LTADVVQAREAAEAKKKQEKALAASEKKALKNRNK
jgi:hypothetical protein